MDHANARLGRRLFFVYLAMYTAYVLVTAIRPQTMDATLAGVNVSIWSGAALIIAAVVLAVVYGWLCVEDRVDLPGDSATAEAPAVDARQGGSVDDVV